MGEAYYNEIEPYAADWLENLIARGHIAPGVVDRRDIRDVHPDDLQGFTQCHFFAGIGVWSYALRRAGWSDDRPVWTGSCPCQPFSAAGRGAGVADERHLWPHWFHLIDVCRPPEVLGEQVASKDGLGWLDLVQSDLEGADYAFGAQDLCAAGVGAPHIRQRLYFAGTSGLDHHHQRQHWDHARPQLRRRTYNALAGAARGLADLDDPLGRSDGSRRDNGHRQDTGWAEGAGDAEGCGGPDRVGNPDGERQDSIGGICEGAFAEPEGVGRSVRLADDDDDGCSRLSSTRLHGRWTRACGEEAAQGEPHRTLGNDADGCGQHDIGLPGPTNGPWRDADWLYCRDGKWRPVEPGTFPLAHGASSRVGRLRAYGNAIVAQVAQHWIETFLESEAAGHADLLDIDVDLIG